MALKSIGTECGSFPENATVFCQCLVTYIQCVGERICSAVRPHFPSRTVYETRYGRPRILVNSPSYQDITEVYFFFLSLYIYLPKAMRWDIFSFESIHLSAMGRDIYNRSHGSHD